MIERRKTRDRRRPQHANDAWINLPPIIRVGCAVAIILLVGWLVLQAMQLVTMLTFVLAR
jgi:hypothetical protein